MKVRVEIADAWTVFRPEGALNASTAADLREAMALMAAVPRLVSDLEAVFIDSVGMTAMVSGIRGLRAAGTHVTACSRRPDQSRVIEMIGLEHVVPVMASTGEAHGDLVMRA